MKITINKLKVMYQKNNHSINTFSAKNRALGLLLTLLLLSLSIGQLMAQTNTITVTYTEAGSNYTFTVPCNATNVNGEAWGGGAGGGTAAAGFARAKGGGGGGGAYTTKNWGTISGSMLTISVGAGGGGGEYGFAGQDNVAGANGGASTIDYNSTIVSAGGGTGGKGAIAVFSTANGAGGSGGTWSGGDSGTNGNAGANGGNGGNGANGGAGGTHPGNNNSNGNSGTAPGGGGSGASYLGAGGRSGGDGARGQIILTFNVPTITITSNNPNLCIGDLLSVVDPCSDIIYVWRKDGADVATGATYTPTEAGTYSVVASYIYSGGNPSISGGSPSNELVIKPNSVINAFTNTICNNETVTITPIDGENGNTVLAGTTYTWTVIDAAEVQNTAAGAGSSFSSGMLSQNTIDYQTAVYQVIPSANGCSGDPFNISITLKPNASINSIVQTICNNETAIVTPTNGANGRVPSGTTYSWTVNYAGGVQNTAAGTGNSFNSGQLWQNTANYQLAVYEVTPVTDGCSGNPFNITVILKPTSNINAITDTICSNETVTITPTNGIDGSVLVGTTYTWTVTDAAGVQNTTGGAGSSFSSGQLTQSTAYLQTAVYQVIPITDGCSGTPFNISITLKPYSAINSITETRCNNSTTTITPIDGINGNVPANTTYTWTVISAAEVQNATAGSGNSFNSGQLVHHTTGFQLAIYQVTPITEGCSGNPFNITIILKPSDYYGFDEVTICDSALPIQYGPITFPIESVSGYYPVHFDPVTHCDSMITLHLIVVPTYNDTINMEVCRYTVIDHFPESFTANQDTIVSYLYQSILGYDSLVSLNVKTVYFFEEITKEICDNDFYYFGGQDLTETGVYLDTLQTVALGCDSIIQLNLIVKPAYYYGFDTITICDNALPFQYGPETFSTGTVSGDYQIYFAPVTYCDSIITLHLVVNPTYNDTIDMEVCRYSVIDHFPESFTANQDTVASYLYQSAWGCDSLVSLRIVVNPTFNDTIDMEVCRYSVIDHFPESFTANQDTIASYLYQSTWGCDSLITLRVKTVFFFEERTIEICSNNPYFFANQNLTETGVYFDTLHTVALGCDSIIQLNLTVKPAYLFEEEVSLFYSDQPYSWRGNSYQDLPTGQHVFYDNFTTGLGCDSVYKLTLTIFDKYETFIEDTICFGTLYDEHDFSVNPSVPGLYTETHNFTAQIGCDSIIHLSLWVNNTDTTYITDDICFGNIYNQHGFNIAANEVTTFYDTVVVPNRFGCDSVVFLTLTVNNTDTTYITDDICLGNTYTQHGFNIVADVVTTFYDTLVMPNRFGCDSVIHLALTVNPNYYSTYEEVICSGERFMLYGFDTLPENIGTLQLQQALQSVNGCDSVISVTLTVNPAYTEAYFDTICQGESYNRYDFDYADTVFAVAGDFPLVQNLQTITGCDSIRTLYLHVNPAYPNVHDTLTLCASELPLRTGNRILFSPNTYLVNYETTCGCDSTVWLTLRVYPHQTLIPATVCAGEPYQLNGFNITADNTLTAGYQEHVQNLTGLLGGCDSTVMLQLTVKETYQQNIPANICLGERYSEFGFDTMPVTAGLVEITQNLTTVAGCDSVITLQLTVKPSYLTEETAVICSNEIPYQWHGQTYTQSGNYSDLLQTALGCDSLFVLHLTVNNAYYDTVYAAVCSPETYAWRGQTYTQSDIYNDSFTTANGCDSIYTLVLTVNPIFVNIENVTICDNESYQWQSHTYTQSGSYYDTLYTTHGCDSIFVLNLTVRPTYLFEEEAYTCNGMAYNWHGRSLTASGIYYDSLETVSGCDSVYKLALTVYAPMTSVVSETICQDSSFLWNGVEYTQSGEYTVTFHNGYCDSTATLLLTVNLRPHTYLHANICQGESYEGYGFTIEEEATATPGTFTLQQLVPTGICDSIVSLVLTINPVSETAILDSVWRGQPYLDNGFNISVYQTQEVGEYHYQLNLHSVVGCDSVVTLTLVVVSGVGINEVDLAGSLTLYPNPVQNILHVSAGVNINEIVVYDFYGKAIVRQQENGLNADVSLEHLSNGVYMIRVVTDKGTAYGKVIKQ